VTLDGKTWKTLHENESTYIPIGGIHRPCQNIRAPSCSRSSMSTTADYLEEDYHRAGLRNITPGSKCALWGPPHDGASCAKVVIGISPGRWTALVFPRVTSQRWPASVSRSLSRAHQGPSS